MSSRVYLDLNTRSTQLAREICFRSERERVISTRALIQCIMVYCIHLSSYTLYGAYHYLHTFYDYHLYHCPSSFLCIWSIMHNAEKSLCIIYITHNIAKVSAQCIKHWNIIFCSLFTDRPTNIVRYRAAISAKNVGGGGGGGGCQVTPIFFFIFHLAGSGSTLKV